MALASYVKSPLEPHRSAEHFELDLKCYVGAERWLCTYYKRVTSWGEEVCASPIYYIQS